MALAIVYSPDHRRHEGQGELQSGRFVACYERPERGEVVHAAVQAAGLGDIVAPDCFGLDPVERIHDAAFVRFLQSAYDAWRASHDSGDALPTTGLAPGMRRVEPDAIGGKLAHFCFDAGTPLTAGTWSASVTAVDVALSAAARLGEGESAFALSRPPGHHAGVASYGGYCYLNNAAVAAQWLLDQGAARVAILDVDYHHGNGTQEIFYERDDVLTVSVHADPASAYPYFSGYPDENGSGSGAGFNVNLPLPLGTAWRGYRPALEAAVRRVREFGADVVVVSLGLDTFREDPISSFDLTLRDYPYLGQALRTGKPTLFVLEGGYAIDRIGDCTVGVLRGFLHA